MAVVHQLTYNGWPKERRKVPRIARHYWDFRDELSTDDGLLLKGPRIVIPGDLRETYLRRLHEGHLSAKKVQENAKHVYWPGWEADISDYTMRCQECIKRSRPAREPLQPHDIPEGPWRKLGMDFFDFKGKTFVLICDYFSKFPFMYASKTSWGSLKDRLIDLFASEGFPDEIVTDNGPPFNSHDFNSYLSRHGIRHTTSSPHYPQSNGFIERQIQTVKNMLFKSESETRSFQEVLGELRSTRIGDGLPSPAEILHGRSLITKETTVVDFKKVRAILVKRQAGQTKAHDKSHRAKAHRKLVMGERCVVLGKKNQWYDCHIAGIGQDGRNYTVQFEETGPEAPKDQVSHQATGTRYSSATPLISFREGASY